MQSEVRLRPITENDIPVSADVYADSRAEEMSQSGWPQAEIDNFLKMQFDLQHKQYVEHYPGAKLDLIVVAEQAVGRFYVHRTSKEIRIMDIAVLRSWRKKGIASILLKQIIAESEETQLLLSLHVEYNNPILPYYERLGFVKGELRGVYYYMERRPQVLNESKDASNRVYT
jgi:ribosomal protein S18 acetylase RimI-like enzyme